MELLREFIAGRVGARGQGGGVAPIGSFCAASISVKIDACAMGLRSCVMLATTLAALVHGDGLRNATPDGRGPRFLLRDHNAKFGKLFDRVATGVGARVLRTPVRAPRANELCERFLGSVRRECLDHVLILGERHLERVLAEYTRYFSTARLHQGIGQKVSTGSDLPANTSGRIVSIPVLGGLHHVYRRAA